MSYTTEEIISEINSRTSGQMKFLENRTKGSFIDLLDREVIIESIEFLPSKYYNCENAVFTVAGNSQTYYRTSAGIVIQDLKKVQESLKRDGLSWRSVGVTFSKRTGSGQRYYVVNFRLLKQGQEEAQPPQQPEPSKLSGPPKAPEEAIKKVTGVVARVKEIKKNGKTVKGIAIALESKPGEVLMCIDLNNFGGWVKEKMEVKAKVTPIPNTRYFRIEEILANDESPF